VGKSSVTVNLAIQFQKMNKKVIICSKHNFYICQSQISIKNNNFLIHFLKLDCQINCGSGIVGMNNLSKDQITFLVRNLAQLDEMADIVLVDIICRISIPRYITSLKLCFGIAPSITSTFASPKSASVLEFVMACPEVLLVSTPEPSSLTDSYSLLKALHRNPNFAKSGTQIHVVANRVNSVEDGQAVYDKLNTVVSQFLKGNLEYLGMIYAAADQYASSR